MTYTLYVFSESPMNGGFQLGTSSIREFLPMFHATGLLQPGCPNCSVALLVAVATSSVAPSATEGYAQVSGMTMTRLSPAPNKRRTTKEDNSIDIRLVT